MDQARYRRMFVDESRRHLEAARRLFEGERSAQGAGEMWPDALLRHMHTIKGMAAALNLQPVVEVAHRLESAVAPLPRQAQQLGFDEMHKFAEGLSTLDALIEAVAQSIAPLEQVVRAQKPSHLSLSELTGEYHTLVHEAGRKLGKHVGLSLLGQALIVPDALLIALHAPLVQLLRNAVDHGIETPDVRARLHKPKFGNITLHAQQTAKSLHISVRDDGAGLNCETIVQRAIAQGILNAAQASALDTPATFALLSRPGFSLASQLTPWSGRGMGLDIVRSDLKRLGGKLDVTSVLGAGSEFCCVLPSPDAL